MQHSHWCYLAQFVSQVDFEHPGYFQTDSQQKVWSDVILGTFLVKQIRAKNFNEALIMLRLRPLLLPTQSEQE